MNDMTGAEGLVSLRWWRWVFVVAIVLFRTVAHDWADSASHFGYEIWPLLLVLALVFVSPLVALVDVGFAWNSYKNAKTLSLPAFQWRVAWATLLLANFAIFIIGIYRSQTT